MGLELDEQTETITETREGYKPRRKEPGDADRFSHYVDRDALFQASLSGDAVEALCGKRWTPTRDGMRFPVCPECKEIWESLPDDEDGDQ